MPELNSVFAIECLKRGGILAIDLRLHSELVDCRYRQKPDDH